MSNHDFRLEYPDEPSLLNSFILNNENVFVMDETGKSRAPTKYTGNDPDQLESFLNFIKLCRCVTVRRPVGRVCDSSPRMEDAGTGAGVILRSKQAPLKAQRHSATGIWYPYFTQSLAWNGTVRPARG